MRKLLLFIGLVSFSYANTLQEGVSIQEEQTFWIALFGLALIGIFALFLSSDQMKRINKKHDVMVKVQAEIQQKQQMILEFMGEKIETSTKGIVLHKQILRENAFEDMTPSFFYDEMERFEKSEALLLDATHELVDYLQIKSDHLEIKEESYKLSNVLNETYGFVSDIFKKNKTELVYDIDAHVATELKGDSKRIEQVLRTLLTDIFDDVKNGVVSLKIALSVQNNKKLHLTLHNKDKKLTEEEIASLFSNYSLKEEYKAKKQLDLYIACELVKRMGGTLAVESTKIKGTSYKIELPYQPEKVSLSISKKSKGKNILVMEPAQESANAIANMLRVHNTDVEVYSGQRLELQMPNLHNYDVMFINTTLMSRMLLEKLEKVRNKKHSYVIELKNVYDRSKLLGDDTKLIDMTVQKPLQNEQIYNLIENAFDIQVEDKPKEIKLTPLKDMLGIKHHSFTKFSHVYVLIAEDNLMNQKILKSVLGDSGMKIIVVNNGQEALDEVKKNKELDLIFMDTNMPTMDGYEATKKIREIYDAKQLPIVAISGVGFQNDLDKMASAGANAYLHKPFQIGELYTAFATYATQKKSKVKDIGSKLSKYVGNTEILDIQRGISQSHTAIFYKEILKEVLVNLEGSNSLVERMVLKQETNNMKAFISDTLRLSETIGATSFVKVLSEINQLFVYRNENRLLEYLPLYTKEWNKLEKEIEEYLKC